MAEICPLPLDCTDTYGRLEVDGWDLQGVAWCAYDLSDIYESPAFRGVNWDVEDRPGTIAQPVLDGEQTYSLPMMFTGAVDRQGTAWGNPAGGLLANRRQFEEHFIRPIRTGTASLPAILDVPDPDTAGLWLSAPVSVQPLRLTWRLLPGGYARGVLTLRAAEPDWLDVGEGEGE